MFKTAALLSLLVETPLHAGSGSDLGIVDLPIQREKHTNYPKIEGSSLKGALREAFRRRKKEMCDIFTGLEDTDYFQNGITPAFGPENGDEHAGALGFTDARLLLFPVKSMKNVFVWITCPAVIDRFKRDMGVAQKTALPAFALQELKTISTSAFTKKVSVPKEAALYVREQTLVLEEYAFEKVEQSEECTKLAEWLARYLLPEEPAYSFWKEKLKSDLVVLDDNDFADFVTMSTEVIARTKINGETGTVQSGALWYEEYLPADSILYSLVLASPPFSSREDVKTYMPTEKEVMNFFRNWLPPITQIGGNSTIGKGLVRTYLVKNDTALPQEGGQDNGK